MIKVLVVDDSFFMRKLISNMLNSDPDIEVVGTARDGEDALEKLKVSKPDVITLDLVMPGIGGLSTLKRIVREHPTPVVMLSAYTKKDAAVTVECFHAGAVGFVVKPSGEVSVDIGKMKDELVGEIKTASKISIQKVKSIIARKRIKRLLEPNVPPLAENKVVVIGSSTGGPPTLDLILSELPSNLPMAVLIVQHMPRMFTKSLAKRLDGTSELEVKEAEEGDVVEAGKAYVCPGDFHMILRKENVKGKPALVIGLSKAPPAHGLRPSIDVTMKSVAEACGGNAVGIILTGMGDDGTEGMRAIKEAGGKTIVQDEATSLIFGMPKSVIEKGYADCVLPVFQISPTLARLWRD